MVNAPDKQLKRTDLCLVEHQTHSACRAGRGPLTRGIGILSVILAACGSAFGQFMVQPMRIDVATYPNSRPVTTFAIENQNPDAPATIDLRLVDMTQDSSGMLQTIEPDAQVITESDGSRWVDVGSENQPNRVDISRLRSCLGWLRIDEDVVELSPIQRKVMNLWISIPVGVQGHYCAALIAQTRLVEDNDTGIRTPVLLQFIVPIIINVQGRTMRDEIKLIDAGLTFQEAVDATPSATLVTLGVNNDGKTYARLVGVTRVYGEVGGYWQKVTELRYPETSIIPGVKINLQQDIGRPLPPGKYRVAGALYVNGRRTDTIDKEVSFAGDSRLQKLTLDAALNLDPKEVPIEVIPGARRTTILKVSNTSEAPVTVDTELLLPDHMTSRAMTDEAGNNLRGQDFSCIDWVTIEPTQFTLRAYGSQNLKIVSTMPSAMPNPLPNYYANVKLRATYADGQHAGITQGLIYLNTKGVDGTPRVTGTQLTLAPSAPSRYIVTASFSNIGNTHVLPRCRVLLTEVAAGIAGAMFRDVPMSSEIFNQSGNMLPLETRQFTAVLDVSSVPAGTYYVTAVMQYARGAVAQRQTAVRISDEGGAKSVEVVSLDTVGGPTQIQL